MIQFILPRMELIMQLFILATMRKLMKMILALSDRQVTYDLGEHFFQVFKKLLKIIL